MTADARSLPLEVGDNFDFDSQAGILFVMRAIRAADITSADKNALKDLVFLYSTGGKDAGVKKKLADTLATHGVTPQSVLNEAPKISTPEVGSEVLPAATPGFMGGRLTPVFTAPAAPVIKASDVAPSTPVVAVQEATIVQVVKKTEPVAVPMPPKVAPIETITPVVPTIRPVVSVPKPAAAPIEPVSPIPEPNNIEIPKKSDPIPAPAPTPTPAPEATPEYVSARMERIRIIKSDVNARVGNPVNLVDVDNTLGREYMSALLEAMKLLTSASEQESTIAMQRLESVYTQVLALLETKKEAAAAPMASISVPATPIAPIAPIAPITPVAPVVTVPVPQPQPEIVAPVSVAPAPEIVAPVVPVVTTTAAPQVTAPVAPVETVAPVSDFISRSKVSEKPAVPAAASNWDTAVTDQSQSAVEVVPSVTTVVAPADATTVARMSTPPAEPLRSVVLPVTAAYTPVVTPPVSEVTPLRTITELPTADEVSAIEAMSSNPLYTKDIDAGLDQLLGEWSIFKKSGLFGTGPSGREHPLYTKISGMQVPLILSGRFEGSTQEIKQSITDYMNGWRYEQGIIYEANETFDQYLRRVIRHIIDLQKTKRRS